MELHSFSELREAGIWASADFSIKTEPPRRAHGCDMLRETPVGGWNKDAIDELNTQDRNDAAHQCPPAFLLRMGVL
ncbi:hypothetical protein DAMNIGENAA_02320 [Desulforhabdus amnigena]|jgi:hypothetical protein|uniref:Uncharacterized protein n=1 Tax=Desulforhabdus amnigena TaxID=40218 RepID=A0A9W6D0L8_9BACT|nr:hypothetical protein DAMNIGENAA_02320 [Desulforhabdus amnigena]